MGSATAGALEEHTAIDILPCKQLFGPSRPTPSSLSPSATGTTRERASSEDREKAIREQYDAVSAHMILLHLVEELGVLTGDDRFSAALDCLRKPADYYL